jgi:UDP-glucose:glycoprotein glucosyltransferase
LIDAADLGRIDFMLRYKRSRGYSSTLSVSGYGVELAVKNTEYKVTDDRDIVNDESTVYQGGNEKILFNEIPKIIKLNPKQIKCNFY